MAITKSARKAIRQNARRRTRNIIYREKIKSLVKKVRFLVSEKKNEEASKILPQIYKALDKAAKRGVIKKNTADRKKSRLTRLLGKPK